MPCHHDLPTKDLLQCAFFLFRLLCFRKASSSSAAGFSKPAYRLPAAAAGDRRCSVDLRLVGGGVILSMQT